MRCTVFPAPAAALGGGGLDGLDGCGGRDGFLESLSPAVGGAAVGFDNEGPVLGRPGGNFFATLLLSFGPPGGRPGFATTGLLEGRGGGFFLSDDESLFKRSDFVTPGL